MTNKPHAQLAANAELWQNSKAAKLNLDFEADLILTSLLNTSDKSLYYTATAHTAAGLNLKLRLSRNLLAKEGDLLAGSIIKAHGKLNLIAAALNATDFDNRTYWAAKGIYVEFTVKHFTPLTLKTQPLVSKVQALIYSLQNCKYYLQAYLRKLFVAEDAGFIQALLIASGEYLNNTDKTAFRSAGIIHTLVASGQHLQIFLIIILSLIESSNLKWKLRQRAICLCLIIIAFIYLNEVAFWRSCLQYLGLRLAQSRGKNYSKSLLLLLSCTILLLLKPYLINSNSLYLSFVASGVIYEIHPHLSKKRQQLFLPKRGETLLQKYKRQILADSSILLLIQVAYNCLNLLPNTLSLSLILGNFLVLGQLLFLNIGILLILLIDMLFFSLTSRHFLSLISSLQILISYLRKLLTVIQEFAYLYISQKELYFFLTCFLICLYLKRHLNRQRRTLFSQHNLSLLAASLFSLILACYILFLPYCGLLLYQVDFLSIGQGDAALITYYQQFRRQYCLLDGGSGKNYRVLATYLKAKEIAQIDLAIISHFDEDHYGGILALVKERKVKKIIANIPLSQTKLAIYQQFRQLCQQTKIEFIALKIEETAFTGVLQLNEHLQLFLWRAAYTPEIQDENHYSIACVLRSNAQNEICFTGDMDKAAEIKWLEDATFPKGGTYLLKVAHHGSKSSSSSTFLRQLQASYAVISLGNFNKYRHPHAETIRTLNKYCQTVYRTDLQGTITVRHFIYQKQPTITSYLNYSKAGGYFKCLPCTQLSN